MKLCYSTAARYAHTRRKRIAQELNELDADDLLQLTESDMQARYALEGAPASCYEELSYWEQLEHDVEMEQLEAAEAAAASRGGLDLEADDMEREMLEGGAGEHEYDEDVFKVADVRAKRGLRLVEED